MKELLILILLTLNIQSSEILGMEKKEFQATIINSIIDGATNVIVEAKELIINPPNLTTERQKANRKKICTKKYWAMRKQTEKEWWRIHYINIDMEKALREKLINYKSVLKQQMKKSITNIEALKKESCNKEYFDLAYKQQNRLIEINQKYKILQKLIIIHNIKIVKNEEPYYSKITEKKTERNIAKNQLFIEMNK